MPSTRAGKIGSVASSGPDCILADLFKSFKMLLPIADHHIPPTRQPNIHGRKRMPHPFGDFLCALAVGALKRVARQCTRKGLPVYAHTLAETQPLPGVSRAGVSNNLAENSMRPVALGRKNWIHVGSPQAGPKVAAIFSVVESCRRLKLSVLNYLAAILPGLSDLPIQRLPKTYALYLGHPASVVVRFHQISSTRVRLGSYESIGIVP